MHAKRARPDDAGKPERSWESVCCVRELGFSIGITSLVRAKLIRVSIFCFSFSCILPLLNNPPFRFERVAGDREARAHSTQ